MNMQRLKHAWARGARIQHYGFHMNHDGQQWANAEISWLSRKGWRDFRIHPDDAHLEYGPVSTAFRDMALYEDCAPLPEEVELFLDLAGSNWVLDGSGTNLETADFCRLFFAEYLADLGL